MRIVVIETDGINHLADGGSGTYRSFCGQLFLSNSAAVLAHRFARCGVETEGSVTCNTCRSQLLEAMRRSYGKAAVARFVADSVCDCASV